MRLTSDESIVLTSFVMHQFSRATPLHLQGTLAADGWLDLLEISFVMLEEVGLAVDSSDREIWQFAQANQMLLLTAIVLDIENYLGVSRLFIP